MARSQGGRRTRRRMNQMRSVLLASLSTQSLNQFAENLADAEALNAEIASFSMDLRSKHICSFAPASNLATGKDTGKQVRKAPLYTPIRI